MTEAGLGHGYGQDWGRKQTCGTVFLTIPQNYLSIDIFFVLKKYISVDVNRVKLRVTTGETGSDYINASYINVSASFTVWRNVYLSWPMDVRIFGEGSSCDWSIRIRPINFEKRCRVIKEIFDSSPRIRTSINHICSMKSTFCHEINIQSTCVVI